MTSNLDPSTNYLNPGLFKDFIDSIPKIPIYASSYSANAAMTPFGFKLLFMFCYYCALRISEALMVSKEDINLERRILRVPQAKTGKNQKTSIPMPLLNILQENWEKLPDSKLFKVTRQTAWVYGKKIGDVAKLNLFESQDKRDIEGVWTHLFRKSYAKMMQEKGADISLIKVKLRHTGSEIGSTFTYIKPDINALIKWEDDIYG